MFVPGSVRVESRVEAPVVVENLPEGWHLDRVEPSVVEVTLAGRRRDFLFQPAEEVAVRVDALLVKLGRRTFEVDEDAVHTPPGLTAIQVEPRKVKLSLTRTQDR